METAPATSSSSPFCSFSNKVAVVTGASSGIGAGTAVKFARLGCSLVLTGRNDNNLNQVKEKCVLAGLPEDKILCHSCDITDEESRKTLTDTALEKFGKINILVNSAGILIPGSPVPGLCLEDLDSLISMNVKSLVALSLLFLPHLMKTNGNIVNVSSLAGMKPLKNRVFYCMSKAAVDMFTKCMALDMARHGVRVNSVNPGVIPTNIHSRRGCCGGVSEDKEFFKACAEKHPMSRNGTVEEVANAIVFLSSDEASYINGDLMKVDGGVF